MLGMFGSMAVIFLVHMLKGKVNDVSTIERNSLIPLIGQTPYLKREEDRTLHFQKLAIELELKRVAATDTRVVISSGKIMKAEHFMPGIWHAPWLSKVEMYC